MRGLDIDLGVDVVGYFCAHWCLSACEYVGVVASVLNNPYNIHAQPMQMRSSPPDSSLCCTRAVEHSARESCAIARYCCPETRALSRRFFMGYVC